MTRGRTLLLVAALAVAGCTQHPKTTEVADVSKGHYYTNDEIKGLPKGERDRYCAALDAEIAALHAEADRLLASSDSLTRQSDSLKTANSGLVTQIRDLDNEIRQLRLARRAATTYLVKAGDTLQGISQHVYGDGSRWKEIWEANKDQLGEPGKPVTPGIRLTIPAK